MKLSSWQLVALTMLGALALVAPSLGMGFYSDDYVHQLVLDGELEHPTLRPENLYDFGSASDWEARPEGTGGMPWWTSPDWKTRFFRPLTSLSLRADHALFGKWAPGYHLTSLAWYALVLVLAYATWRVLGLSEREALVALALFAATCGAGVVAGWPANRNSLVASAATLAAVLVTARGRGRVGTLTAGFGFAAAACAGKESGVLAFALLAVWYQARDASGQRRSPTLAVAAVGAAVVWVGGLWLAGFGSNSAFYASPWGDPLRYAEHVAVLLTAGVARLVVPMTVDLVVFAPGFAAVQVGVACGFVAVIGAWVARRVRGAPAVGMLVAWLGLGLLAQGGAPPSDRLLFDAAFGSAGLLAVFLARVLPRAEGRSPRERRLAWAVVAAAGPLSALATFVQAVTQTELVNGLRRDVLAAEVGPTELGRRELVVLQASSGMLAFVLAATWAVESEDREVVFTPVQMGRRGLRCTRVDERTLVVRSEGAPFLGGLFERVYLSDPKPPGLGARFEAEVFQAEVVEESADGPTGLRLEFDRSLDDPTLRLLADRGGRLAWVKAPGVGETLVLEEAMPPIPLLP